MIEIPKSRTPPHMYNHVYYQRLNYQTERISHWNVFRAFQTSWVRRRESHQNVKEPFYSKIKLNCERMEKSEEDNLLLFGKFYDIEIDKSGRDYNISLEDQKVRIRMPNSINAEDIEYEYLRKWIRNRLREILHDLLRFHTHGMKASANKIYIKNQKTRWASYSTNHNLSFNIKLAALHKNIIEYVVIHELAHNKHRNHSKKFWLTVGRFCPDYESRKQELEKYSLKIQENKIWQRMLKD